MAEYEVATFAGGCFWCMVAPFDEFPGVIKVVSGYTGGHVPNPTYEQVCRGDTGHVEAVQITPTTPRCCPTSCCWRCSGGKSTPPTPAASFATRAVPTAPPSFTTPRNKKRRPKPPKALAESGRFPTSPLSPPSCRHGNFGRPRTTHQHFYKKNPAHYQALPQRLEAGMSLSASTGPARKSPGVPLKKKADGDAMPRHPAKRHRAPFKTNTGTGRGRASTSMLSAASRCSLHWTNATPAAAGPALPGPWPKTCWKRGWTPATA